MVASVFACGSAPALWVQGARLFGGGVGFGGTVFLVCASNHAHGPLKALSASFSFGHLKFITRARVNRKYQNVQNFYNETKPEIAETAKKKHTHTHTYRDKSKA